MKETNKFFKNHKQGRIKTKLLPQLERQGQGRIKTKKLKEKLFFDDLPHCFFARP